MNEEFCVACDEPTGKSGKDDDSLYIENFGPLCEDCYDFYNSFSLSEYQIWPEL